MSSTTCIRAVEKTLCSCVLYAGKEYILWVVIAPSGRDLFHLCSVYFSLHPDNRPQILLKYINVIKQPFPDIPSSHCLGLGRMVPRSGIERFLFIGNSFRENLKSSCMELLWAAIVFQLLVNQFFKVKMVCKLLLYNRAPKIIPLCIPKKTT